MPADDTAPHVSLRACLYAGDQTFDLGMISSTTPQGLCDNLADRLELLAKHLRGGADDADVVRRLIGEESRA